MCGGGDHGVSRRGPRLSEVVFSLDAKLELLSVCLMAKHFEHLLPSLYVFPQDSIYTMNAAFGEV
jgi:hypothetical protein